MNITKEQWRELQEIAQELASAEKCGKTIDGINLACRIRDIIGYEYPEPIRPPFGYS